jgi:uncharacterized OB-fold protein
VCLDCGSFHWYPASSCPFCGGDRIDWKRLSGRGTLYSYTVVHHAFSPLMKDRIPYIVGLIDLPDAPGVRLVTDLINVGLDDVRITMSLRSDFERLEPDIGLVHFEPMEATADPV